MKKRVLATILTVCLLFSVLACVAGAADEDADIIVGDIISSKRICPGDVIDDVSIGEPSCVGAVYTTGWEILDANGHWVPYQDQPINEKEGTVIYVRYFAADISGEYAYSNACEVTVEHNPQGAYQYSGTDHWRICADCGGEAEKGGHDHLTESATAANKVCTVCGHVRTSQYTGILAFIEWLMALVGTLLG